jgi:hypothetical protein
MSGICSQNCELSNSGADTLNIETSLRGKDVYEEVSVDPLTDASRPNTTVRSYNRTADVMYSAQ